MAWAVSAACVFSSAVSERSARRSIVPGGGTAWPPSPSFLGCAERAACPPRPSLYPRLLIARSHKNSYRALRQRKNLKRPFAQLLPHTRPPQHFQRIDLMPSLPALPAKTDFFSLSPQAFDAIAIDW